MLRTMALSIVFQFLKSLKKSSEEKAKVLWSAPSLEILECKVSNLSVTKYPDLIDFFLKCSGLSLVPAQSSCAALLQ